ncbi:MAG: hypothetical protein A2096_00020 [Spirochaetes bacterium GWF1_41_5]|nr:MAG: hypothetical protein A2096_00020 [Spirochaetes bacterium GWF1_41_5]HBE02910.1 hypothetical protein [Spirochaetia bacterium]
MKKLPNMIIIHSDQHRFDCIKANGHEFIQTPALDRLAGEGVNFTCAFTPSPICSPARASLMNGAWPVQHGCMSIPGTEIFRPAKKEFTLWSNLLAENGYQLGYVGKYHQEFEGTPLDYGFSSYHPLSEYNTWRSEKKFEPLPRENGWFGEKDPFVSPRETRLAWGAGKIIELLKNYHNSKMPFLLRWDPVEPHLPNIIPDPYFSMYAPGSIRPWPNFSDELRGKPYIQAQQKRTWEVDGWTWEKWAPLVSRYLGEISLLDHEIGRVLDCLDETGMADNTCIIYTTDHGDMCGAHGMIDKHFIMYDDVMHVPLIMRFPGKVKTGSKCRSFVINEIDIAATVCDIGNVRKPETFTGKNLVESANNTEPEERQDVFGMWHGGQFSSYSQRMVRDRKWKYIWNMCAEDELYDLAADPAEIINHAADPGYRQELHRLRMRMISWMESVNDVMLNPWTRKQLAQDLKA